MMKLNSKSKIKYLLFSFLCMILIVSLILLKNINHVEAEVVTTMTMEIGSSVRTNADKSGIRFEAVINNYSENEISEEHYGMLIVPSDYLPTPIPENYDYITDLEKTHSNLAIIEAKPYDINNNSSDPKYVIRGVLTDISEEFCSIKFFGVAFKEEIINGNISYTYATFNENNITNNIRSIEEVAGKALKEDLKDNLFTDEEKNVLQQYAKKDDNWIKTGSGNILDLDAETTVFYCENEYINYNIDLIKEAKAESKKYISLTINSNTTGIFWYKSLDGLMIAANMVKDKDVTVLYKLDDINTANEKTFQIRQEGNSIIQIKKIEFVNTDENVWINVADLHDHIVNNNDGTTNIYIDGYWKVTKIDEKYFRAKNIEGYTKIKYKIESSNKSSKIAVEKKIDGFASAGIIGVNNLSEWSIIPPDNNEFTLNLVEQENGIEKLNNIQLVTADYIKTTLTITIEFIK